MRSIVGVDQVRRRRSGLVPGPAASDENERSGLESRPASPSGPGSGSNATRAKLQSMDRRACGDAQGRGKLPWRSWSAPMQRPCRRPGRLGGAGWWICRPGAAAGSCVGARRGGKLQQYSQTPGDLLHRKRPTHILTCTSSTIKAVCAPGQPAYAQARRC